jgi:hypothetical protein
MKGFHLKRWNKLEAADYSAQERLRGWLFEWSWSA